MAEVDDQSQQGIVNDGDLKLKYLGFVHFAALQAAACFTSFYGYAKEKSGSLKPGVQTVEEKVTSILGPLCMKYQDTPYVLLKFVDQKVDSSVSEFERCAPVVKQVTTQAVSVAQKAPGVARAMVSDVQRSGVLETAAGYARSMYDRCEPAAKGVARSTYAKCEPTAKGLYGRYEKVAERYAVSIWKSLLQLPLFPQVAKVMVPTAAFCSEKYNMTVQYSADKGYKVASFLPLVPTEKIAKVFNSCDAPETEPLAASTAAVEAD